MNHRGIDESMVSDVSSKDDVADYRVIPADQTPEYVPNEPTEEERQAAAAVRRKVELEQEEKKRQAAQQRQRELAQVQSIQKQHYIDALTKEAREGEPITGINEFSSLIDTFDNYFGLTYKKVLETLPTSTAYRQYFGLLFGAYIADKYSNINISSPNSTFAHVGARIHSALDASFFDYSDDEFAQNPDISKLTDNLTNLFLLTTIPDESDDGQDGELPAAEWGNIYSTTIKDVQTEANTDVEKELKNTNDNQIQILKSSGLLESYIQGQTVFYLNNLTISDTIDRNKLTYSDEYTRILAIAGIRITQLLSDDDTSGLKSLVKEIKKNKGLTREEKRT